MGFLEELAVLPSATDPCGFPCKTEATLSESNVSSSLISGTYPKKKKKSTIKNKKSLTNTSKEGKDL